MTTFSIELNTTTTMENITALDFVKNQLTPDKVADNRFLVLSINEKTLEPNAEVINLDYSCITDRDAFKHVVSAWYYTSVYKDLNTRYNLLTDKISELEEDGRDDTDRYWELRTKRSNLRECIDFFEDVNYYFYNENVVELDETPVTLMQLATIDLFAQAVASTVSNLFPLLNHAIAMKNVIKEYYENITDETLTDELSRECYTTLRNELESYCVSLATTDTPYSKDMKKHVNSALTKKALYEVGSRYYKGRSRDKKTGRVKKGYDKKGVSCLKELIFLVLEKYQ